MAERFAHTPEPQAMRLPGYLVAFVLTLLLASTTPVGTGAGVHEFDLLHPLFSHMHLVNGRLLTHEQMAAMQTQAAPPVRGLAVGAGSGAPSDDAGVGISPTVPDQVVSALALRSDAWAPPDPVQPRGRVEAPPDPPPL